MKMTKDSYNRMQKDLIAAKRLFDNFFQMLPDEECSIPYRGSIAVQDLQDWLQKNVEIVE